MAKKSTYIHIELEWLERKLQEFRDAIDSYNLINLVDRIDQKPTKNGGVVRTVIASKEDQLKAIMFIMEKLPKILEAIDLLREKADSTTLRGDEEMPDLFDDEI